MPVIVGLSVVPSAAADSVVLKGSVRLAIGVSDVRLGDIADLDGPRAERLADTVIAEVRNPAAAMEIALSDVRQALEDAEVHWGKVQLSGRTVIVRPAAGPGATPPMAMTAAAIEQTDERGREARPTSELEPAGALVELPTLEGAVARAILAGLGIGPERLRLRFDEADREVLDSDLETYRYEIQPLSSCFSDRIELSVRAWSGGRIEAHYDLTVTPMIRCEVAVARHDLGRGDELRAEDLSGESRWLPPSQVANNSTLVHAVGRVTDAPVKAGDVLRKRDVKHAVVVKRGDRVMVRCLVGGVVITLEAEARDDAARDERVELRKLGERETFFATVTGPGAAVMDLSR